MAAHPSRYATLFGCHAGTGGAAVVVGVPYDRGTSPQRAGCAAAPAALRQLSAPAFCRADLNGLYDQARREVVFAADGVSDLGDIRFRTQDTDESYLSQVSELARLLAQEGKKPVVLGGDHLVTLAVLRGMKKAGRELQVVQLDAHHDADAVEPGERPTHSSFVTYLANEGLVKRVFQVGIRGYSWGPCRTSPGVETILPAELGAALLPGVQTYLTVDTDGFDPALAGAVNYPEHDGLTLADLDSVLRQIALTTSLVGADWTEYNPTLDSKNSLTGHYILRGLGKILRALCSSAPY